MDKHPSESMNMADTMTDSATDKAMPRGLSLAQNGFNLSAIASPSAVDQQGELSFQLTNPNGSPLTEYKLSHEKDLHLIVVRSDGAEFKHVHPATNGRGGWSIPWKWNKAGTYRVFTDFVPAQLGEDVTLTRTVEVAGNYEPVPINGDTSETVVEDYKVELRGKLTAGTSSTLSFTVSKNGQPVTTLEPYLGAYGHLVALRQGDLAYLHVHPLGEPANKAATSGPTVQFMTEVPTSGTYLLYLDFQVGGTVHTAPFIVTAT